MMKSLKNIMHSSRAVLALNGTLMIVLGGAFVLARVHTRNVPRNLENETAVEVAIALRKNMGAGCVFIE